MQNGTPETQKLEWIRLSQAGDIDAFGQLVRENQGWLRGWLRGQLRDWTAADDLAQDSFVTAFKKIKKFRGDGSFEAWIRSIAHNHFRNYIRKHREEYIGGTEELQHLLISDDHEVTHSSHTSLEALRECLSKVKDPAQRLLEERYLHGKSVREIAAQEDAGYSTMTMKLHRLRKSLATCIEKKIAT